MEVSYPPTISTLEQKEETTSVSYTDLSYTGSLEELFFAYRSSTHGLTSQNACENQKEFGSNLLTPPPKTPFIKKLLHAMCEPMILLLFLAAAIAVGVNLVHLYYGQETNFWECAGIFLAIFLSIFITLMIENKSEKAFEALSQINANSLVCILRDGAFKNVAQNDLVVGDIIKLQAGDKIPSDIRIISSNELECDESSLTGESKPIKKQAGVLPSGTLLAERSNMLYKGCFVTQGIAQGIVVAVGDNTEFGKIALSLSKSQKQTTPLQEKMAKLSSSITIFGVFAALIAFLVQFGFLFFREGIHFESVSEAFITSIVLIVASVPEGLPTIVAICLALSVFKMSQQNALVRKMIASETLGSVSVLCSDKTGTLTQNKMSVQQIYYNHQLLGIEEFREKYLGADNALLDNFALNSTADLEKEKQEGSNFIGNPTEGALLACLGAIGISYEQKRQNAKILRVFPFSSQTKKMGTLIASSKDYILYYKGAPEMILAHCNLGCEDLESIKRQIAFLQENAMRVLCFAHKILPQNPSFLQETEEFLVDFGDEGLVFDGFVGICDPLRPQVPNAVRLAKEAGIEVKILTGDNLVTASAIARELELINPNSKNSLKAVEAKDLENLSTTELAKALKDIAVIARSTPLMKQKVVEALKGFGEVVAITGDGINDAPAMARADIGIAMGISGSQVAKEASDVVLLDDSFATIIKAISWGRTIYQNFQRFIQFQLTVNLSSVIVVLFAVFFGFSAPFSALWLLWINLIMDGPPALTLGLEPNREDLLKQKPIRRDSHILTFNMLWLVFANGIFIAILTLWQFFYNFLGASTEELPTVLFTLFVLCQLLNAFNCREVGMQSIIKHLKDNTLMLAVFAGTFLLQVVIVQFGGTIFNTVPLSLDMWGKILLTSLLVILFSELWRFCFRIAYTKKK